VGSQFDPSCLHHHADLRSGSGLLRLIKSGISAGPIWSQFDSLASIQPWQVAVRVRRRLRPFTDTFLLESIAMQWALHLSNRLIRFRSRGVPPKRPPNSFALNVAITCVLGSVAVFYYPSPFEWLFGISRTATVWIGLLLFVAGFAYFTLGRKNYQSGETQ
jgi:hypothetical protein